MSKSIKIHLIATVIWTVILILAIVGGILEVFGVKVPPLLFLLGVAFISLCSIYANMVGHWGAYQASRAEESEKE